MHKKNENSLKYLASNTLVRLQKNKTPSHVYSPLENSVSYVSKASDVQNVHPQNIAMFQLSSIPNEHEERLAIAEYDGHQAASQAERIAYLDAFMALLATLPYEDIEEDWLSHRARAAQEWLSDQGMAQPK
jgi:hypothetical protein